MLSTILPFLSIGFGTVAILSSIASIATIRREHRARQRAFAELAAELASIRAVIAALEPPTQFLAPDGRHNLRRDRGRAGVAITGPILITVPDLSASDPGPVPVPPELAERFSGIWELSDSGASADAIARATGQPIGQIELILALRRPGDDEGEA